jgi:hypothetical protein
MKRADILRELDTILRSERRVGALTRAMIDLAEAGIESSTLAKLGSERDRAEQERDSARRRLAEAGGR